jgi:hypothetical protein
MPEIKVTYKFNTLCITIEDIIHLYITDFKPVIFQSWKYGSEKFYAIEYVTTSGNILTEYDNEDIWLTILQQLKEILYATT